MSNKEIWFDEQLSRPLFWEINGKRTPIVFLVENTKSQSLLPSKFKIGPASEGIITHTSVEQSRWVITSHECREEQSHPEPKQETWRDRPPLL